MEKIAIIKFLIHMAQGRVTVPLLPSHVVVLEQISIPALLLKLIF